MRLLSDLAALTIISRVKFFIPSLNFFVILVKLMAVLFRFLGIYIAISRVSYVIRLRSSLCNYALLKYSVHIWGAQDCEYIDEKIQDDRYILARTADRVGL